MIERLRRKLKKKYKNDLLNTRMINIEQIENTLNERLDVLNTRMINIEQIENTLNGRFDLFNTSIQNRKELFYQKYLEKYCNNKSHKVTKFGITDISTDTHHIEIK